MGGMDSKCAGNSANAVDSLAERSNGVACRVPSYGMGGGSLNKPKLPMPHNQELEQRFAKVLVRNISIYLQHSDILVTCGWLGSWQRSLCIFCF